jgi:peptide chain release factor 1
MQKNERLCSLLRRYDDLVRLTQDPELVKDQRKYRETMKEYAFLSDIAAADREIETLSSQIADVKALFQEEKDPDMRELAKEELRELELRVHDVEDQLKFLLIPRDPLDEKNIIMEIRAGTGGEEAALFAADLFRMYSRFAETRGWKFETMNVNETELGGLKEIIFSISGSNVYVVAVTCTKICATTPTFIGYSAFPRLRLRDASIPRRLRWRCFLKLMRLKSTYDQKTSVLM